MFASQIQKSVTKTLNTHDRRHPLQAASLDIGDDNVLLQLGRLGVKPKKSQEKLALAAIAAAAAVPVAVYGDSGANKKVNSHGGKDSSNQPYEKKKVKTPFQPVKKGKLGAIKEKSNATSNILGELKSPTTSPTQSHFDVNVDLDNTEGVSLSLSQSRELDSTRSVKSETQSVSSETQNSVSVSKSSALETQHVETVSKNAKSETQSDSALSKGVTSESHKIKTDSALTSMTSATECKSETQSIKSNTHDNQEVQIQVKLSNQQQQQQTKTNKINKSKFKIFSELATEKSVKQIDRQPKQLEGEVNLISWMKDKGEGDAKPSAITTEDANKIKQKVKTINNMKNVKETMKTTTQITRDVECKQFILEGMTASSEGKSSSKGIITVKEENIEVVDRIKTTNIVPVKLEGVMMKETRETKSGPNIVLNEGQCNNSFTIHATSNETTKESIEATKTVTRKMTKVSKETTNKIANVTNKTTKTLETSNVAKEENSLQSKPFTLKPVGLLESKKTTSFSVIIPQSGTTKEKLDSTLSEDSVFTSSLDSTSPGKRMWKTFKRADREKKEEVVERDISSDDKKMMFKAKRSMSMAVPNSLPASFPVPKTDENDAATLNKTPRPKLTRSMTDIGRQDSLEDIRIEMDELLSLRSWKNDTETKTKNKMRKMIVKAKAQWKSYEYEPGQLDYDKYYRMKEKHKELMRLRRTVSEVETGSLDRERLESIEKTDEEQEKLNMMIRVRDKKAEEAKEERIKQKTLREEEKKLRIIEAEAEKQRIKEEEGERIKVAEEEKMLQMIKEEEEERIKVAEEEKKLQMIKEEEEERIKVAEEEKKLQMIKEEEEERIKVAEEEKKLQMIKEEEEQVEVKIQEEQRVQNILSRLKKLPLTVITIEKEGQVMKNDGKVQNMKNENKIDNREEKSMSREEKEQEPLRMKDADVSDCLPTKDIKTEMKTEQKTANSEENITTTDTTNKIKRKPALMKEKLLGKLKTNNKEAKPTKKKEIVAEKTAIERKKVKHEIKQEIKQDIKQKVTQEFEKEIKAGEINLEETKCEFKQEETKQKEIKLKNKIKKEPQKKNVESNERKKEEQKINYSKESVKPEKVEVEIDPIALLKESIAETKSTTLIDKKIEKAIYKAKVGETKPEEIVTLATFREKRITKSYLNDIEDVIEQFSTQPQQSEKEFKMAPERIELINLEPIKEEMVKPGKKPSSKIEKKDLVETKKEKSTHVDEEKTAKQAIEISKSIGTSKPLGKKRLTVTFKDTPKTNEPDRESRDKTLIDTVVKNDQETGRKFFHAFGDQHTFTKSVFLERVLFGEDYEKTKTLSKDEWFEKVITKIRAQLGDAFPLYTKDLSSWELITSGRHVCKTDKSKNDNGKLAVHLSNNRVGSEGSWEVVARGFRKKGPDFDRSIEKCAEKEKWHSIASGNNGRTIQS